MDDHQPYYVAPPTTQKLSGRLAGCVRSSLLGTQTSSMLCETPASKRRRMNSSDTGGGGGGRGGLDHEEGWNTLNDLLRKAAAGNLQNRLCGIPLLVCPAREHRPRIVLVRSLAISSVMLNYVLG